jgi:hypothetical protein
MSNIMSFVEDWSNFKEFFYFTYLIHSILEIKTDSKNKKIIEKWVLDVLLWIIDFIKEERIKIEKNKEITYSEKDIVNNISNEQTYLNLLSQNISDWEKKELIPKNELGAFFSFLTKKYRIYEDEKWFNNLFRNWINKNTCENIQNLAKVMIFLDKGKDLQKFFEDCNKTKTIKINNNWLEILLSIIDKI